VNRFACSSLAFVAALTTSAALLIGCSSSLSQRSQRADGLLGFIFDFPGPDILPVERVSGSGGEIITAHATADGRQLRVSGLVRKASLSEPPRGSHIDILVHNPRGKIIASVATDYFPRDFPPRIRGNPGNVHYVAHFSKIPPAGSTVQVIFHAVKKTACPYAHST
jgi:hypothetical protein